MRNIVKLLEESGNKDLAMVIAQIEDGSMPIHDPGRIDNPKPSQPDIDEQVNVPENNHSNNSNEVEEQKNLYNVNINCIMSFNIEIQAKDESEAINISPSYAIDTLDEIKDILNKNFRSFNISFNKIAAKEAKEVIAEE